MYNSTCRCIVTVVDGWTCTSGSVIMPLYIPKAIVWVPGILKLQQETDTMVTWQCLVILLYSQPHKVLNAYNTWKSLLQNSIQWSHGAVSLLHHRINSLIHAYAIYRMIKSLYFFFIWVHGESNVNTRYSFCHSLCYAMSHFANIQTLLN